MFRKKNKEQATPKGVVGTNIEDIRLPNDVEVAEYDFDMKRNR